MDEQNQTQTTNESVEEQQQASFDYANLSREQLIQLVTDLSAENQLLIAEVEEWKGRYERSKKIVAQATEQNTAFQRLKVDFENYKRRNAEIAVKAKEEAEASVALQILPVYDNFLLAASSSEDEGVKMIQKQFEKALSDLGIERIEALGEKYDLNLHDAIMSQPVESEEQDEVVVQVYRNGYMCKGKVLRHAQVVVGKYNG
ncbi:MAG: nucleotide exchange factor GrpE [Clostridia bacterium]|nr:nucleotide exchange factor GrpE [Clostridia bacterium]